MHGVINLLKPPGMTSHDAVSFVRRTLKIKRVGHTGTLDPAAAGVLPICVGHATRLVEYLQAGSKTYIAEATFGFETDTLDRVGQVLRESDASGVTLEAIRAALDNFRGEIDQIPPVFSAIKRDGQKLYDLARAGKLDESELTARRVTIHNVFPTRFVEGECPRAMIHIECSSGTYIRSLVRDLGRALGCAATMTFLVRTQSGAFDIQNAATLEEIAANPAGALIPIEEALRHCGLLMVTHDGAAFELSQGRRVGATDVVLEIYHRTEQQPELKMTAARILRTESSVVPDSIVVVPDLIAQVPLTELRPQPLIFINEACSIAAFAVPAPENNTTGTIWYKPEKVLFLHSTGH